jgi:pimeloyl-ACP methyl ester carboxylesterase
VTILRSELVDQVIDRRSGRQGRFLKQRVLARGDVPLHFVRKRAVPRDARDAARLDPPTRATVLLIHGYGQNRYAWHLPSRSFANHLAAAGFDVWNVDLRGQGRSRLVGAQSPHALREYIEEDMPRAIDEIVDTTGRPDMFLVGHSLGGLLSYATAPLMERTIRGVVTIGSPYLFTRGSTTLRVLASLAAGLEKVGVRVGQEAIPLKLVAKSMQAARRYLESPLYPLGLRGWHAGAIEPEILAEHLDQAFDSASVQVMLTMFGWSQSAFGSDIGEEASRRDGLTYAERFERCRVPLLVIAGTGDDMAPPASVEPAYLRSNSPDKSYRELPLGHIDLLVGTDAPKTTWLIVERWLRDRSMQLARASGSTYGGFEELP